MIVLFKILKTTKIFEKTSELTPQPTTTYATKLNCASANLLPYCGKLYDHLESPNQVNYGPINLILNITLPVEIRRYLPYSLFCL